MIQKITHVSKHLSLWLLVAFAIALTAIRLSLMGVEGYKNDLETQLFESDLIWHTTLLLLNVENVTGLS